MTKNGQCNIKHDAKEKTKRFLQDFFTTIVDMEWHYRNNVENAHGYDESGPKWTVQRGESGRSRESRRSIQKWTVLSHSGRSFQPKWTESASDTDTNSCPKSCPYPCLNSRYSLGSPQIQVFPGARQASGQKKVNSTRLLTRF